MAGMGPAIEVPVPALSSEQRRSVVAAALRTIQEAEEIQR
jgi:hypothetical protein